MSLGLLLVFGTYISTKSALAYKAKGHLLLQIAAGSGNRPAIPAMVETLMSVHGHVKRLTTEAIHGWSFVFTWFFKLQSRYEYACSPWDLSAHEWLARYAPRVSFSRMHWAFATPLTSWIVYLSMQGGCWRYLLLDTDASLTSLLRALSLLAFQNPACGHEPVKPASSVDRLCTHVCCF